MDASTVAVAPRQFVATASRDPRREAARLSDLRGRRRAIVIPLFAASFLFYVGTLVLLSYGPTIVGQRVSGSINVAYVLAILQFVATYLVAVVYALVAKRSIDPVTDAIASEMMAEAAR